MTSKNIWDGDKRSQFRRLRRREEDDEEEVVKTNMTPAEEYKEYCKTVFARSYIASFADVAETPSNIKKALKLGIFFFSVFGLFYQTTDFTRFYSGYPTLKNEFLLRPYYMKQPAITICNANRYRRQEYCKRDWVETTDYYNETAFCDEFRTFCPDPRYGRPYLATCKPKIPDVPIPYDTKDVWEMTREMSHSASMIVSCTEKSDYRTGTCEKPYSLVPTISNLNQKFGATYCYTINSLVGKPHGQPRKVGRPETITLELKTQLDEYVDETERPSIYVSVHDRRRNVNPFTSGKRLYGGNKYTGYVMEMTEKKLMPPPYDTNCTDFVTPWEENGGHGPLTNQECTETCKIKKLVKENKCIPYDITISHTQKLCKDSSQRVPRYIDDQCRCKYPCFERIYKMDWEENGRIWCERKFFNISDWCRGLRINLTISFQKFWYIKVNNDPRIQDIEFFSNVGGYLGMWIGISLVDFIDFLGCVYLVAYFPILRKKLRESQKIQDSSLNKKNRHVDEAKKTSMALQTISDGRPTKVFFRDPTLN